MMILVTGGAGFIGSNLVDQLLADNTGDVVVLDNFSEGRRSNLPGRHPRLTVMNGDIRNYSDVYRAMDGASWVFHLAAMSRIQPSIERPRLAIDQNIEGTFNVLEAAKNAGVKRLVYSASSSAYGRNVAPHREAMKTDCLNFYSLTKKVGEEMCQIYNDLYGLPTVSLRYFNVYGPKHQEEGDYATVIAIFMRQIREGRPMTIVGDGTKRRDFTFVTDVVRANLLAAMNRETTGVLNVGTGTNLSINEVTQLVADACGEPDHPRVFIPDRPAEALVTKADVSRAKAELGWTPTVPFSLGLKTTYDFQKASSPIILAR
jgi:UDP-glucose 4-epimerase